MLESLFGVHKPVIGVIHLMPLPGSYGWNGDLEEVMLRAEQEALALGSGGVDGIIFENFFDAPFARDRVDVSTACAMTLCGKRIVESCDLPVGVNVLRNDALTALAVATACGAQFVRVNVLSGAMLTDQGIIEGDANGVLNYRRRLVGDDSIKIFADVMVKHAYPLSNALEIGQVARETMERARADSVIVSGTGTGAKPDLSDLKAVKEAVPDAPVLIGSGSSRDNVAELLEYADGIIVGTSVKRKGKLENPVDVDRVRQLVDAVRELRD